MQIETTELPEVLLLTPRRFEDQRGSFSETFNARAFAALTGVQADFVQDNQSVSMPGVLRGLHYQIEQAQGKLVRVMSGAIHDVAVDLRRASPRFGHWVARRLDAERGQQLWVPAGFAHGFLALADGAVVMYKTTDYYAPEHERCIRWDDGQLAIDWPLHELAASPAPLLSDKDARGSELATAEVYP